MSASNDDWDARIAAVWASVQSQTLSGEALVAAVDALAAERTPGDAAALFERACARDTAGIEDAAEGYYRAALAIGQLDAYRSSRNSSRENLRVVYGPPAPPESTACASPTVSVATRPE